MADIQAQEDVLVSDIDRLAGKLEKYLDCIMTVDNTGEQAASIPKIGRLLLGLYQSGQELEVIQNLSPSIVREARPQAVFCQAERWQP